jgi:hypothetical protein
MKKLLSLILAITVIVATLACAVPMAISAEESPIEATPLEIVGTPGRGTDFVKAVDVTESGDAIEIWFQKENEIYVMYLFNYEAGVIKCGR